MPERKRFAVVGLGGRSQLYVNAIAQTYRDRAELVAFCDANSARMALANRRLIDAGDIAQPVPAYAPDQFARLLDESRCEAVIVVCGPDVTHSDYILAALAAGREVITEKPMTTDEQRCGAILRAAGVATRPLRVTFNYRYAAYRSQIKRMLMDGAIGEVLSVDFTWLLDTRHGADYFRRWHRHRRNSGSLLVHKATHHFDLVNWWLADAPEEVFCHASRGFYTPQHAEALGLAGRGERCLNCPVAEKCRFRLDLAGDENLRQVYLDCEGEDGYFRDRCVFDKSIDIWDNMSASVRYGRGAMLSYLLIAYSPWEGYRVSFNGTAGRLEHECVESSYISGEQESMAPGEVQHEGTSTRLFSLHEPPRAIEVETGEGGHGGGDPAMLADLFDPPAAPDPLGRAASQRDGALSVLTGVAAYRSVDSSRPVRIADLLGDAPLE